MDITQKQWQLYYLGFYGSSVKDIDGIFGPKSEAATRAFQEHFCLEPDGIFGPLTEAKSREVIASIQNAVDDFAPGVMAKSHYGLAGPKTLEVTKTFQKRFGLTEDGIADTLTRSAVDGYLSDLEAAEAPHGTFWDEIKYFVRDECKCKCGGKYCNGFPVEPDERLLRLADQVREHFGVPMIPSSVVRCKTHNANVGGVSGSRHLYGRAMDFCVKGKSARTVLAFVRTLPGVNYAYAIDASYVHMDVK